jgi:hypothetical protein
MVPFDGWAEGYTSGLTIPDPEYQTVTCKYCGVKHNEEVQPEIPWNLITNQSRFDAAVKARAWLCVHIAEHYRKGEIDEPDARVDALLNNLRK